MLSAALVLAGCGMGGAEPSTAEEPSDLARAASVQRDPTGLLLDFEQGAAGIGAILSSVENSGDWAVSSRVTTLNGGRVRRDLGVDGGFAARFPTVQQGNEHPAAAVITISAIDGPDGADRLDPGAGDFAFGADFVLDRLSVDGVGDNGDNVVQWGLFSDPTQYKLQVDHGIVACRVAGAAGEAIVKAEEPVAPGTWYRARCERRQDHVLLELTKLDTPGKPWVVTENVSTGDLDAAGVARPLSVGGKVSSEGQITASATDQFNGAVDNVRIEILA